MKPNIIGGPIGSDTDLMLDVYMTRDQREAYERLRKDAYRYRWLREKSNLVGGTGAYIGLACGVWTKGEKDKRELDRSIDEAMASIDRR